MNADRFGIPAQKAERASWRATKAYRFNVGAGFVLLATVPPPAERPGGWTMLLMAHDSRDGAGTYLRGAWWLGPGTWENPMRAFSQFVGRFGVKLATEQTEGIFYLNSPGQMPPQPVGIRPDDVELHALPQPGQPGQAWQTGQPGGAAGWAWCFGIDRRKHREYLKAVGGKR
ncbi:MAG TPA: hypothetical protein VG164_09510 [Trebonia sp.]|jgi:hypothetical protein|nr:hypothetical protein [Trebonia sp.]